MENMFEVYKKHLVDIHNNQKEKMEALKEDTCPECGADLIHVEGCRKCGNNCFDGCIIGGKRYDRHRK